MITQDNTGRPFVVGDLIWVGKGHYSKQGFHIICEIGTKSLKTVFLTDSAYLILNPPAVKHISFVRNVFKLDADGVINGPITAFGQLVRTVRNDVMANVYQTQKEHRARGERRPRALEQTPRPNFANAYNGVYVLPTQLTTQFERV